MRIHLMKRERRTWLRLLAVAGIVVSLSWPIVPSSRADNFEWRQLFYDDFERGASRWRLDPGWQIQEADGGNHLLAGEGPAVAELLSPAPWQDHRLVLRVKLIQGELMVHLRRNNEKGTYTIRLREDHISLFRQSGQIAPGQEGELASASLSLQLGIWHYLAATFYEDHLMISVNGTEYINYIDLFPLQQGTLSLQVAEGCQAQVDDLWITGLLPLPSEPPDPRRISVGGTRPDGVTDIQGAAGAVPARAVVYLANLQTLDFVAVTAEDDGSFNARLFAPQGSTLQISYAFPGALPLFESIGLEGSPAILVTVHGGHEPMGDLAFTIGDRLNDGYWIAQGELPRRDYQPGDILTATLHLRVESSKMMRLDLSRFRIDIHVALQRLFDEEGHQLPLTRNLVSAYLTPSGLPVEAEVEAADPWIYQRSISGDQAIRQEQVLTATIPLTIQIPVELPAGIYRPRPRIEFKEQRQGEWQPVEFLQWNDDYAMLERQDKGRTYPWPLLPPVKIGSPAQPRLTWALLTDYTSNSERGIRALEDSHYCLSPRTVFPTHRFIVPMVNEMTGEPISYLLEPSLPLTSWGFRTLYERVLVCPPSIPFLYPGGELHVQVTKPNGETEDLGLSTFLAGLNPLVTYRPDEVDATQRHRSLVTSFDNPGPSDYYRAWTGSERLRYTFTQYGRHVISLSGWMQDIWGNFYEAGGTYEVWIAHPLDLETGTLLGTPFEVGDVYSPVVRIQPAVPAQVTLDYTLYINSSQADVEQRHIRGRANSFGYFHPGNGERPIYISAPGEYDVLITASYWDAKGELWMGAMRGANVVETPGTSLVAHGERGIRSFAAVKRPAWFAEGRDGNVVPGQTDGLFLERVLGGSLHLAYPYFAGDVMWLVDLEGQNSIFPTITFDDLTGEIADLLERRVPELRQGAYYYGQFPTQLLPIDRRAIGELPLVTTTSAGRKTGGTYGWPVGQFPELADQIGYFYSCCVRPDLCVAFQVSESGLGNAYWFADDNYNLQYGAGVNGDIAPDFKLNFGGLVFRDLQHGVNEYAIYSSCDVYIPTGDEMSNRVMPPFRGAAGGYDGGPLMTIKGKEVNLFVHPTAVKPGTILEVGDVFSFAAQVVPTLDSHITVTVTLPSGQERIIAGQANKIGYFYDPLQDFMVTEAGLYQVRVKGEHRGMTSAGPVQPPYPSGDILGSEEGSFYVFVVERDSSPLALRTSDNEVIRPAHPLPIQGFLPESCRYAEVYYIASLSGFILQQGTLSLDDAMFTYLYDPVALHADFPNLDISIIRKHLAFIPWDEPEAVDTVQINLYAVAQAGERQLHRARAVTLQGAHLFAPAVSNRGAVIRLGESGLAPDTAIIMQGQEVIWLNEDRSAHRIIGDDGWDSGLIYPGDSSRRTFSTPGEYIFRDESDPSRQNRIIVNAASHNRYLPMLWKR